MTEASGQGSLLNTMTYRRIDMLAQLGRLATGKETDVPVSDVARWAIEWARIGIAQTKDAAEVRELERLLQK